MTEAVRSTLQLPPTEPPGSPTPVDFPSAITPGVLQSTRSSTACWSSNFCTSLDERLRGLSLDSRGNAWVASQGNTLVYAIRPDGTEIGHFNGGGMDGPWDTAIDGEDNVWVANFGPLESGQQFYRQADKTLGSQCACGSQRR